VLLRMKEERLRTWARARILRSNIKEKGLGAKKGKNRGGAAAAKGKGFIVVGPGRGRFRDVRRWFRKNPQTALFFKCKEKRNVVAGKKPALSAQDG